MDQDIESDVNSNILKKPISVKEMSKDSDNVLPPEVGRANYGNILNLFHSILKICTFSIGGGRKC